MIDTKDATNPVAKVHDADRERLWRDVLVIIYVNMGYQQRRRKIFERQENLTKAISLVIASAAYASIKSALEVDFPHLISILLLAIVMINSCALVFRWGDKARDAERRYDAWARFDAAVQRVGLSSYNYKDLTEWRAQMAELSLGESEPNPYLVFKAEKEARRILAHKVIATDDGSDPHQNWKFFDFCGGYFAFN